MTNGWANTNFASVANQNTINGAIRTLAKTNSQSQQFHLIDLNNRLLGAAYENSKGYYCNYASDGVHLLSAGYSAVANLIAEPGLFSY